jgi:hypothetical protein
LQTVNSHSDVVVWITALLLYMAVHTVTVTACYRPYTYLVFVSMSKLHQFLNKACNTLYQAHSFIYTFSLFVCLTTVPQPLPNRILHRVRSSASSFNLQYPLLSLLLSSKCIRLLLRLPVTSIFPSTFPLNNLF